MRRALREYAITGVPTTIDFHQRILEHPGFIKGEVYTNFVEQMMSKDGL
jgi:acetyl-CoA carboxylase, biotin carboxylase subunit